MTIELHDPSRHGTPDLKVDVATCGTCDRTWCDTCYPTPVARCPFEAEHEDDDPVTRYVIKTEPENGCVQVVLSDPVLERFDAWLVMRGWERFPIPTTEDDLPTFGVRPKNWPR